ncbi:MAG: ImmA/IrrE family metallo-endopeptidase [Methylomicrobium sp.]
MTVAHAKINPMLLGWARDRAQLSVIALADKLGVSEEKLKAWEDGEKPLTFRQAQSFANKTHIPFGYLFLPKPPEESLPLPDLRTIDGQRPLRPSAELLDIIRIVLQRQSWYRDYLLEQGETRGDVAGRCNLQTPISQAVQDMRQMLKVSAHPDRGSWDDYFRELIQKIEQIGVLVMRQGAVHHWSRPLSVAEFRGFAVADKIAPVIFINQADAPSARLFTLIHELAHIWIGQSGISNSDPQTDRKEEIFCNAAAAEFLVPETEFLALWKEDYESWQQNIAPLEAHFHVSPWVLARRALTLNKVTLQQYQQYIANLHAQYKMRESTQGGPTYYRTKHSQISDRFSKAVVAEALSGRLLLRDAGRLLDMKPNNIQNYAKELGI